VTLLAQVVAEVVLTPSAYCYRIYTQIALEISIATASYPSILHQVREHHNHPTLSLIDHLPEVSACKLHWSLGNDESLVLLVAICKAGMDVVFTLTLQYNPPDVSYQVQK